MPPSLNFPQLDFVKPSSGFHPVTWERVTFEMWKEEGNGVNFSLKFFFQCGVAREGKGFIFFTNLLWGRVG